MKNSTLKQISSSRFEKGFTLVEILVALAISGIVMAGIYSAYYTQQRSYEVQEQVVAIQQNLRAAMYFMEREVRMAGLDPVKTSGAAVIAAGSDTIQFSGDGIGVDDPDGTIETETENITYYLEDNRLRRSTIDDGTGDPIVQTLAEGVEVLDFVYLNSNGAVIPQPIDAAAIGNIASVQIAMVAKSERPDPQYNSSQSFTNMQGELLGIYTDKYRREVLTAQVKCRNIGMD